MLLQSKNCRVTLDDGDGRLISIRNDAGKEFICNAGRRPLLELRLRDTDGNTIVVCSNSAKAIFRNTKNGLEVLYTRLGGLELAATIHIRYSENDGFSFWGVTCRNKTPHAIEWVSLPITVVPNDLTGNGGAANLLYPFSEGLLIEDAELRTRMGYHYHPVEYPCRGLEGLYPGSVCSQFMAYCSPQGGLYWGAHDSAYGAKTIEYRVDGSGIELEFRLFTGCDFGQDFELPYDVVLGTFSGDWMAAAEIYRNWTDRQSKSLEKPKKQNTERPEWLSDPLVVVTYPVRGTHDLDRMEPNEFYPYTNGLRYIDAISEKTNSRVLVLLMQWESTAPWAPPYVWPPYGDQKDFHNFVDELHRRGHLIGVYASGIGWTLKSKVYDYLRPDAPYDGKFTDMMCIAPDGSLPLSNICSGHREGYDFCPAEDAAVRVVREEIMKMAEAKLDYAQYFDQNMGGGAYFCYARHHHHPPMPGAWLSQSVCDMMEKITVELKDRNSPLVIGCEGAAAEPFIHTMQFNDLRYNVGMFAGKPVPLYAYLYHENIFNFMGNQVCSGALINNAVTPESMLFRIAYSFIAGDIPTLVLKRGGEISWAWGDRWDVQGPEQEPIFRLLRKIAEIKRGPAKEFLVRGRMIEPFPVKCETEFALNLKSGDILKYPPVLAVRWQLDDREEMQIMVNYTNTRQNVEVILPGEKVMKFSIESLSIITMPLE